MTNRPTSSPVHAIIGVIVVLLVVLASPGLTDAHTEFVSSMPADDGPGLAAMADRFSTIAAISVGSAMFFVVIVLTAILVGSAT